MSKETIGAAMTAMVDANCFGDFQGRSYTEAPRRQVRRNAPDTVLFDNTDDSGDNDYPAAA